jgi:hypothetical protein
MAESGTSSSGTLQFTVEPGAVGPTRVRLSGAIGEDADLGGAFPAGPGDLVLNLRDIERMNSMGVHHWIRALREALTTCRVELEELSYAVVLQANRVANIFAQAVIRSCCAPYFCPACDRSVTCTVTPAELDAHANVPARSCETCGGPLEFDELGAYFDFLRPEAPR